MTDMRETVARALAKHDRIEICSDASYALSSYGPKADAALSLMQPEIDRRVAEERADLESKFRCVVSHFATGGNFQDIDASLSEISVRISQFRTQLWEQAKQIGAKEEKAKLLERLREPTHEMVRRLNAACDTPDVQMAWVFPYIADMLAQFEKENSDA